MLLSFHFVHTTKAPLYCGFPNKFLLMSVSLDIYSVFFENVVLSTADDCSSKYQKFWNAWHPRTIVIE
jgi:hypothetical protein